MSAENTPAIPRRSLSHLPLTIALALVLAGGALLWRSQLVRLAANDGPRPLLVLDVTERRALPCDVVLPAAPVGMIHLRSGRTPLLLHYWAPWERHGRAQAAALDSLARDLRSSDLDVVLVSFDPFPSVARFVARQGLRLRVLLDGPGQLRAQVPCPRLPHTVLIDRAGRAAAIQSGEIDWLSPATRAAIERVLAEPAPADTASPRAISAHLIGFPSRTQAATAAFALP